MKDIHEGDAAVKRNFEEEVCFEDVVMDAMMSSRHVCQCTHVVTGAAYIISIPRGLNKNRVLNSSVSQPIRSAHSELCGLAYLIFSVLGLIAYYYYKNLDKDILNLILQGSIMYIVIGSIIVFIAFLGYYGAIRENHCMIVTFAALLLTILIIEVIIAIYTSVANSDKIDYKIYTKHFNNYPKGGRTTVDFIQEGYECCGIDGPDDFARLLHISIPGTCCGESTDDTCNQMHSYKTNCVDALKKNNPGDIALVVIPIGIELIVIIFTVCLVNSIRNAKRRGHAV